MLAAIAENSNAAFAANFNWSNPGWDFFILAFFGVAVVLYGLSLGRDRIIVILVSIYMALAFVNTAPFIPTINASIEVNGNIVLRITTFLGIFVLLFFLLSRSGLKKTIVGNDDDGGFIQVLVYSILHVGLLLSVLLTYLPPDVINSKLSPLMRTMLVGEWARFAWITLPIVAMVIFRGKKEKKYKYDV